jgi:hypothetical protein
MTMAAEARLDAEVEALRARNAWLDDRLSEALDRQTATGEILRVIASLSTDAQPVFDTIVRNAVAQQRQVVSGDSRAHCLQLSVAGREM